MSLLANGVKATEVVETALSIGLLEALESGPVSLESLSSRFELLPGRLYKLLDCLESLGFVHRYEAAEAILTTQYRAVPGVRDAALASVGPAGIEHDRDKYPWRQLHGRLAEVLRGQHSMPVEDFVWPPADDAQVAAFEESMAAGLGPIIETFRVHSDRLWESSRPARLLDVGGGDGTLATHLVDHVPQLTVDVYNLPAAGPLVEATRKRSDHPERLGFVAGDFLTEPLPAGYDSMSFVRVLHDWPAGLARHLLSAAHLALPAGGQVLICEEFRTSDRLAIQFFWSYFLIGVDSCVSRLREIDYYTRLLQEMGFVRVDVLPGPFELIIATKPAGKSASGPASSAQDDLGSEGPTPLRQYL